MRQEDTRTLIDLDLTIIKIKPKEEIVYWDDLFLDVKNKSGDMLQIDVTGSMPSILIAHQANVQCRFTIQFESLEWTQDIKEASFQFIGINMENNGWSSNSYPLISFMSASILFP